MLGDDTIGGIAAALAAVPGVVGVLLGGSRARGEGPPSSDVDLGIYYDGDVPALEALAAHLTGAPVPVAGPQGRGSWVDGGAWLSVGGTPVEWGRCGRVGAHPAGVPLLARNGVPSDGSPSACAHLAFQHLFGADRAEYLL